MTAFPERRKYERIEAGIPVSFAAGAEKGDYASLVINMSQGGMLLKSPTSFPVDLAVIVKVAKGDFADKILCLPGRVSRCEEIYSGSLYHMGVEIDRSDKKTCLLIDALYRNVLEKKRMDSESRLKKFRKK